MNEGNPFDLEEREPEDLFENGTPPGGGESPEEVSEKEREELREPVRKILEQIRPQIESGTYRVIIGDDASGRIPMRIIGDVIKMAYADRGFPSPKIHFVALHRSADFGTDPKRESLYGPKVFAIRQELEEEGAQNPKALLVTDSIYTGSSLDPLVEDLEGESIDFDVVAVGNNGKIKERWGKTIISGMDGKPAIYGKEYSGVTKTHGEVFAHPMTEGVANPEEKLALQKKINQSREHASRMAKELYDEWRG